MHPPAVRAEALALVAEGLNDCEVARRMGLPRETVRSWRAPAYVRTQPAQVCARCWEAARPMWFSDTDYAELLGLYLGDSHIVRARRTFRLRLFLDSTYPQIIDEARALLERCFARNGIGLARSARGSTTTLSVYCRHLPCLVPQHGPGTKHERPIVLEDWQRHCLEAAPMSFIRGCIRSDGCYFINRTGAYRYPSYAFVNLSADIRDLLAEACDRVGIAHTRTGPRVRICRRESVAILDRWVGPKA